MAVLWCFDQKKHFADKSFQAKKPLEPTPKHGEITGDLQPSRSLSLCVARRVGLGRDTVRG